MKQTKCGMCRRPTVWTMGLDRVLRCKNCNKPATPSLRANRCKHLFMDKTTKEFSESCVTGCGIVLSKEAIPIMKKIVESYRLHSLQNLQNQPKPQVKNEKELEPNFPAFESKESKDFKFEAKKETISVPLVVEDNDLLSFNAEII